MFNRWALAVIILVTLLVGVLAQPEPLVDQAVGAGGPSPIALAPATPSSRSTPPAPPPALLPRGLSIAGLPVGDLTLEQARASLERRRLAPLRRPRLLRLDETSIYLDPQEVGLQVSAEAALERAATYTHVWQRVPWRILLSPRTVQVDRWVDEDIPLSVDYDKAALWSFLDELAQAYDRPPVPFHLIVLTDTAPLLARGVPSPTWALEEPAVAFESAHPGQRLDTKASFPLVEAALLRWEREPVDLQTEQLLPPERRPAFLERALRRQVASMPGVVGVFVHDLQSGRSVGVRDDVVFSGASVIKIAIMIQAYRVLGGPPSDEVSQDLWAMMVHSDNEAANRLLKLGGGGDGIGGATAMTEMLARLGLSHSFMRTPYGWGLEPEEPPPAEEEAPPAEGEQPPAQETPEEEASSGPSGLGAPLRQEPVTDADALLQTTPREMGLLLSFLYAGTLGEGPLLEHFPGELTVEECRAMVDLMAHNADDRRMVAGLPEGTPSAHKSGWISDMKADAGIVFSPGGAYILSVFVWQEGRLSDEVGNPRIARLSWTTYSFFNPF